MQSYESIAENLTTEHLCSRTTIWLDYIGGGGEGGRPVPFNLLPTVDSIVWVIRNMASSMHLCGMYVNKHN